MRIGDGAVTEDIKRQRLGCLLSESLALGSVCHLFINKAGNKYMSPSELFPTEVHTPVLAVGCPCVLKWETMSYLYAPRRLPFTLFTSVTPEPLPREKQATRAPSTQGVVPGLL